ncbi:hypothetical protein [Anaeromyxobacter paludicola]|uniref:TIGR03016 family PEP-CTERM system-associated outer membrane protein n=1 Tax=Anaeromyxobacter paludicola TaxID=2918171 RepID=A0ABN6N5W7_9BACT|nr:hypothetical protein [Anaeromyxobacter paludicola]BDG07409.1 hypothetical protein AMPC_05220 [Anaeromyxobacter paludicola]
MSRSLVLPALLAAAVATPCLAFDVSGAINAEYWRSDTWSADSHSAAPVWDLGGSIAVHGSPIRQDLLDLSGNLDYRHTRTLYSEASSTGQNFTYAGSASLFRRSPLSLGIGASRNRYDFTSDGASATTGTTFSSNETANLGLQIANLPTVGATVMHTTTENTGFAGLNNKTDSTSMAASLNQTLGPHTYAAAYNTSWNSGNYSENNYRLHYLNLQETSEISKDIQLRVNDNYLLRDPTLQASNNPRIDDNAFGTSLSWKLNPVVTTQLAYNYHHGVVSAPSALDREYLNHGVSTNVGYAYTRSLSFNANLGFNNNQERLGDTNRRASGEQIGGGVNWFSIRGPWQYNAGGQLNVGLLHDQTGTNGGYGASATTSVSRRWERLVGMLGYSGSYSTNLSAVSGWTFSHTVTANADVDVGAGVRLQNNLTASASRQQDPLLGTSFSRNVSLLSSTSWRIWRVSLSAGLTDGLSGQPAGIADGLFIPVAYNSHSAYASVSTGVTPAKSLSLNASARYVTTSAPERATNSETGLTGTLGYNIGAVTFSLEDQYSTGGSSGITQRGNLFMARISRSFGASF